MSIYKSRPLGIKYQGMDPIPWDSDIGGIAETQEMLDFCARHHITADIELSNVQQINNPFERLEKGNVRYRFVINMASL